MKVYFHRLVATIDRVHENYGQIEKGVMGIKLRAEGSGQVGKELILNDCAILRALDLPAALVEKANLEGLSSAIFRAYPIDVLAKITNLVERVPNRKLKLNLRGAGRQRNLNFHQVLFGVYQ
jgi:hypothetical protein